MGPRASLHSRVVVMSNIAYSIPCHDPSSMLLGDLANCMYTVHNVLIVLRLPVLTTAALQCYFRLTLLQGSPLHSD